MKNLFELLFGKPVSTINALELNDRLKNGKRPVVIDVRQPDGYHSGHIAGAKLIPLNSLDSHMKKLRLKAARLFVFVPRGIEVVLQRGYSSKQ